MVFHAGWLEKKRIKIERWIKNMPPRERLTDGELKIVAAFEEIRAAIESEITGRFIEYTKAAMLLEVPPDPVCPFEPNNQPATPPD